jgi:gas vesicle protein
MQSIMKILLTAGAAAASMYYLDPSSGQDRRAVARARLEDGKDTVAHGVHRASNRFDSASRQARDAGRTLGRETGKLSDDARELAAGVAGTVASFLNRNRSQGKARAALRSATRGKFLIPGWLITTGVGAAAMYFFSPSQGEARRARLYERLDGWRDTAQEKVSAVGRKLPRKEEMRDEAEEMTDSLTDSMTGNGSDRLRKQDGLQDRPLQAE